MKEKKKIKALKPSFLTVLLLLCLWFFDQIKETSFHGIWPNSSLKVSKKLNQERLLLYLKRKMEKGTYWSKYIFYKRLKSRKYTAIYNFYFSMVELDVYVRYKSPPPLLVKSRNLSNTKFPRRFLWYGNQIPIAILWSYLSFGNWRLTRKIFNNYEELLANEVGLCQAWKWLLITESGFCNNNNQPTHSLLFFSSFFRLTH